MATKAVYDRKKISQVLVECSVFILAKLKVKEMLWKSQKNCSLSMFQSLTYIYIYEYIHIYISAC